MAEVQYALQSAPPSTVQSIVDALNGHLDDYELDNYKRLTEFFAEAVVETGGGTSFTENLNYSVSGLLGTFPSYFNKHQAEACEYGRIDPQSKKPGDIKSVEFCKALAAKEAKQKGGYVYAPHAANWQAIADRAYAGKIGNSKIISVGDGWTYRGRGMFMVTGKGNYKAFSDWYNSTTGSKPPINAVSDPALLEQPSYAVSGAAWFWVQHGLAGEADQLGSTTNTCSVTDNITKVVDPHTVSYGKRCQAAEKIQEAGTFNAVDCGLPLPNGQPVT